MAKRGRPRNIDTPEQLYELWKDYKESIEEQEEQWKKVQYVGKDGERVTDKVKIPLTFEGFRRYCFDTEIGDVQDYFTNGKDIYKEFSEVCSRIKNEIRENQIIGGMNGFFNTSITQRLNGLADKTEHDIKTEPRIFKID